MRSFFKVRDRRHIVAVEQIIPRDKVWDGGGADDNWRTIDNWEVSQRPEAGDSLYFAGSVRPTPVNNYPAGTRFDGLIQNAGASGFTLSGNSVELHGSVRNNGTNKLIVDNDLDIPNNASVLPVAGGIDLTGVMSGAGDVVIDGPNDVYISANNSGRTGKTRIAGGCILEYFQTNFIGSGEATLDSVCLKASDDRVTRWGFPVVLAAGDVYVQKDSTIDIDSVISGPGNLNFNYSAGRIDINGTVSTYTGKTRIGTRGLGWISDPSSMTIRIPNLANLGEPSSFGAPTTVENGTIELGVADGAKLHVQFVPTADFTTNRRIHIKTSGNAVEIYHNGTNGTVLTFNGDFIIDEGSKQLIFDITDGRHTIINGVIPNPTTSGVLTLRKDDGGPLTINSPCTFTGGLDINNNGALTLGGSGTFMAGNFTAVVNINNVTDAKLVITTDQDQEFSGQIQGGVLGVFELKSTRGTQVTTFSNDTNSFLGVVTVDDCYLSITSWLNGGVACALGKQAVASTNLVITATAATPVLIYTGVTTTTNRGYTANTGGGGYSKCVVRLDNPSVDLTISGVIDGTGKATFVGQDTTTNRVILTGLNTVDKLEAFANVTVQINSLADIGTPCAAGVGTEMGAYYSSAILEYTGGTASCDKRIYGSGIFKVSSTGTLTLTSTISTYTGATQLNTGTLSIASAYSLGLSTSEVVFLSTTAVLKVTASITLENEIHATASGRQIVIDVDSGVVLTQDGNIRSYNGASIVRKIGDGTLRLLYDNTQLDTSVQQEGGVIDVRHSEALGNSAAFDYLNTNADLTTQFTSDSTLTMLCSLKADGNNATYLTNRVTSGVGSGMSVYDFVIGGAYTVNIKAGANVASGMQTFAIRSTMTLNGNTIINTSMDGSGCIYLKFTGAIDGIGHNLTLQGSCFSEFYGDIGLGTGTLTLTTANYVGFYSTDKTYTGLTTINNAACILYVNNITMSGGVTVALGVLAGHTASGNTCTINGAVTVANTTGAILEAGYFGNATMNVGGGLTISGANAKLIAHSTTNTFSLIAVTGNVALGGCVVDFPAGITTNGTYKLITATGTMSGTLPTIGVNGTGKTLVLQQNGNDLEVVVS